MKRIAWLVLILALSLPALTRCIPPELVASQETPFDALARWVSGDAGEVFFLDLKPDGEAGRHWGRIRHQLEANPAAQEGLDGLFRQFRVEEYGVDEFIVGPAVNWSDYRTRYVIARVSDEEAAEDALLQHSWDNATWKQEQYEGRTIYHGRSSKQRRERLAWTIHDGLLFLALGYDQEALTPLQVLVSLAQADSLAALPSWRALRGRLPETPMGLLFFDIPEETYLSSSSPDGTSLRTPAGTLAFAAVPEEKGMRVEIAGAFGLQTDASPGLYALFDLPAVDAAAWPGLPADTAIALVSYDVSVLWPWLKEMFGPDDALVQLGDTVGLDLEADLASAEGPLNGDFALAITQPLPGQPISQGLPAGQMLILARGASESQMTDVQTAVEGRGAVFGPGEIEGVALQTQAGTELTGYAISYGFDSVDGDTLLFGSSPDVIGQGVAARRERKGLVTTETFQAALATLPDDPSFVVYLNSKPLTSLLQANMTEEEYQGGGYGLEAFEAISLGLRLKPDGLVDGVVYFFVR